MGPRSTQVYRPGAEELPFVVSVGEIRSDEATRRLVRSHARKHQKREAAKGAVVQASNSESSRAPTSSRAVAMTVPRINLTDVLELLYPPPPLLPRVGSDYSLVQTADRIEPAILRNVLKVSPIVLKAAWPLLNTIGHQRDDNSRLYPIATDPVALHILAFSLEGFVGRVLRGQKTPNPQAMAHLDTGVRLLRSRLAGTDELAKISDATIGVCLKLATVAHFQGDTERAREHMRGVRQMVILRGGVEAFDVSGELLIVEVLRYDIGIAMLNGIPPLFYQWPAEKPLDYPARLLGLAMEDDTPVVGVTSDVLSTAWRVMRRFCAVIQLGCQTGRHVHAAVLHETMTSVMYRLLATHFPAGSTDELVRHGLLAFCYHAFLQWQDIKLPYNHFLRSHRRSLEEADMSPLGTRAAAELQVWILVTGGIALYDVSSENNAWLVDALDTALQACSIRKWMALQALLKSFLWINVLDEQWGKDLLTLAMAKNGPAKMTTRDKMAFVPD